MRLFHVHPGALPTALLINQHRTAHLLLACIASGKDVGGVSRYHRQAGYVAWFHWLCVQEMLIRGMNHDSPISALWARIPVMQRGHDVWVPPRLSARDVKDLTAKMKNCNAGGRMDDARMPVQAGVSEFMTAHARLRAQAVLPAAVLSS